MTSRRASGHRFQPSLDALQERIAPVSLFYIPPVTADLTILTTSPVMTSTSTPGGTELLATSPVCTSG